MATFASSLQGIPVSCLFSERGRHVKAARFGAGVVRDARRRRLRADTSQVFGKVTDVSGALLPGATVTLSSPALLEPRVAVTSDTSRPNQTAIAVLLDPVGEQRFPNFATMDFRLERTFTVGGRKMLPSFDMFNLFNANTVMGRRTNQFSGVRVTTHAVRALGIAVILSMGGAQVRNPRDGDPAAIQAGAALFRERCADCHGADAKGVRGPDLTGCGRQRPATNGCSRRSAPASPAASCPPAPRPTRSSGAIVAYLRSISTAQHPRHRPETSPTGSGSSPPAARRCHRVNGRGGRLGPDLSRIAANQSNQVLARAIRDASAAFTSGYEPVTLVARDGQQIRGTRKGEDAFSIQIMDTTRRLQGYLKANLREVAPRQEVADARLRRRSPE